MRRFTPLIRGHMIPLVVFLMMAAAVMGCHEDVTAPLSDENDEALAPHHQRAEAPAKQATLSQQLNAVRKATKKYRDLETARDDGYAAVSPYVPGMGFHFADGPPFGTDLENPGVLVYFTNGTYNPDPGDPHDPERDDDLILGAAEYLVPGDQEDDPPNIFADETSPRNLKVTEEHGWHFEEEEGFTGLHAWVHRGNPAGVFHSTNPNIE